jgi:hypothetical protein
MHNGDTEAVLSCRTSAPALATRFTTELVLQMFWLRNVGTDESISRTSPLRSLAEPS